MTSKSRQINKIHDLYSNFFSEAQKVFLKNWEMLIEKINRTEKRVDHLDEFRQRTIAITISILAFGSLGLYKTINNFDGRLDNLENTEKIQEKIYNNVAAELERYYKSYLKNEGIHPILSENNDKLKMISGATKESSTLWAPGHDHQIWTEIRLPEDYFYYKPRCFVTFKGDSLDGIITVKKITLNSFRVFICKTRIKAETAQKLGWHVEWIALAQ